MKRFCVVSIFIVLFFISSVGFAKACEADFYVSPDGSDNNSGTLAKPFASLARARDAVGKKLPTIQKDIVVLLRGGQYFIDDTVVFGPLDSGRNGWRVIYRNYPGEKPVLIGGRRISGWKKVKGNLYKTAVDTKWQFHQLFENGISQIKARHPNSGYLRIESAPDRKAENAKTEFVYRAGDIGDWKDWRGGQAYIWASADWFSNTIPILRIDTETRTIKLAHPTLAPIRRLYGGLEQRRYFLQGIKGALDSDGEFWQDPDSGELFYRPIASPIEKQQIVAPTVMRIVALLGKSPDDAVSNISFEGIEFSISKFSNYFVETDGTHGKTPWNEPANKEGAVYLEHANNCRIKNCRITNAGFSGVSIVWSGRKNVISGCEILDCGFHGVLLSGYRAEFGRKMDVNKYNEVSNNWIHDCGKLVGHGGGIFIWASSHNEIVHNRICDMPRYGICMKGQRYADGRGFTGDFAKKITRQQHFNYVHSRNNRIAFNDIFRVSQDTEDNGFISFWGTGMDNLVDNNLIHDIGDKRKLSGLSMGIYLDDGADYFKVTNNIIYNIDAGSPERRSLIFAKGLHNVFENNILIGDRNTGTAVKHYEMAGEPLAHHIYKNNIIQLEGDMKIYGFRYWSDLRVAYSDYNLIYNSDGKYTITFMEPAKDDRPQELSKEISFEQWRELMTNKYETHTVQADPMFVDKANHDYRLRDESPAFKLGFKQIDVSKVGLFAKHPYFKGNPRQYQRQKNRALKANFFMTFGIKEK